MLPKIMIEFRSMKREKIMTIVTESNDSHESFIIKDLRHLLAIVNPLRGLCDLKGKKRREGSLWENEPSRKKARNEKTKPVSSFEVITSTIKTNLLFSYYRPVVNCVVKRRQLIKRKSMVMFIHLGEPSE